MPRMPINSETCRPLRYSGRVTPKSLMISGVARAKITPSMPSKPQPRPLAMAMCQCVRVTRVGRAEGGGAFAVALFQRAGDVGGRDGSGRAHGRFLLGRRRVARCRLADIFAGG